MIQNFKNIPRKIAMTAIAVMAIGASWDAFADKSQLPTTSVNGLTMYYYDVQPGENIYDVANRTGIPTSEIIEQNPTATDGIKSGMRLFFAAGKDMVAPTTHVAKKGESIYGIAKQYGMTMDRLMELNPSLRDGLKEGQRLRLTAGTTEENSYLADKNDSRRTPVVDTPVILDIPAAREGFFVYQIAPDETLYSIAKRNGVSLEDLLDANPTLNPISYAAGEYIQIPLVAKLYDDANQSDSQNLQLAGNNDNFNNETDNYQAETPQPIEYSQMNVAIILPFMLNEQTPSRQTQLFTEFYNGLLMAADSLRNEQQTPIRFQTYDSCANTDTVIAIMSRPEIMDADLIISPDNQTHMAIITRMAPPSAKILNIFAVKDTSYRNCPGMIQVNIPHNEMYATAIDAFISKFDNALPVFLTRTGGAAEKESFTKALRQRLDENGREYRTLQFEEVLTDTELEGLNASTQPIVFIPASGSKAEFSRFVNALTRFRDNFIAADDNIQLFGYPEWSTFRGENLDELCRLNTTIYSRFYAVDDDPVANELRNRYKQLFGTEMFDAVPTQGLLGFDTGMFIINGLREMADTGEFPLTFTGVQTNLTLKHEDAESGMVNNALFLIHYSTPGHNIEKSNL